MITKIKIFLGTFFLVTLFGTGGWYIFFWRSQPSPVNVPEVPADGKPVPTEEVSGERILSEEFVCNNEAYIFDVVLLQNRGYVNDIYRKSRSPEHFTIRLKAMPTGLDTYFILAVPKENCDRIYLTVAMYETDKPVESIFEWQIGKQEVRELAVSKEFSGDFITSHPGDWRDVVSPDGEKIIVTQPNEQAITEEESCFLRTMRLVRLGEDRADTVLYLPEAETFDQGRDLIGNCTGVNIGWIDAATIYYDVYDSAKEGIRPLKERRTLLIQ